MAAGFSPHLGKAPAATRNGLPDNRPAPTSLSKRAATRYKPGFGSRIRPPKAEVPKSTLAGGLLSPAGAVRQPDHTESADS
jgi:hypothetical protein